MPDITMCHSVDADICDKCVRNEKNTKPNPLYQAYWYASDEVIKKVQETEKCELFMALKKRVD